MDYVCFLWQQQSLYFDFVRCSSKHMEQTEKEWLYLYTRLYFIRWHKENSKFTTNKVCGSVCEVKLENNMFP